MPGFDPNRLFFTPLGVSKKRSTMAVAKKATQKNPDIFGPEIDEGTAAPALGATQKLDFTMFDPVSEEASRTVEPKPNTAMKTNIQIQTKQQNFRDMADLLGGPQIQRKSICNQSSSRRKREIYRYVAATAEVPDSVRRLQSQHQAVRAGPNELALDLM